MAEELKRLTLKDFLHFISFPLLGIIFYFFFYILISALSRTIDICGFSVYFQSPITPIKQIEYILLMVAADFIHLAPLLLYGFKDKMISWESLGLRPLVIDWNKVWKIALFGAVLVVLEFVAAAILERMGINLKSSNPSPVYVIVSNNFFLYLFFVLFIGILAPIMEEIYFRGFFYGWLRRFFKPWVGILISSAVFGLFHAGSIFSICFAFFFAVIAAFLYERDKTIVSSIVLHITVNSLVYLVNFYAPKF